MAAAPAILITRPEPGCEDTARAVAALGWRPVLAPALVLTPLPPPADLAARAQAVLLPSRAAARALPGIDRATPVLAVGAGTAAEARQAGFTQVDAAAGDAASLVNRAVEILDPRAGALLLAVGRGYSLELSAKLRRHGFVVRRRVVYAARPADSLPREAVEALRAGEIHAALFFSPRSASVISALLLRAGLAETVAHVAAFALSERIAAALAGMPWGQIHATREPDPMALLALLGRAPHTAATAKQGAGER